MIILVGNGSRFRKLKITIMFKAIRNTKTFHEISEISCEMVLFGAT